MKKKIQIAIDSPAASGAGTQAKLISRHYKLFPLQYQNYSILILKRDKSFSISASGVPSPPLNFS